MISSEASMMEMCNVGATKAERTIRARKGIGRIQYVDLHAWSLFDFGLRATSYI